MKCCSDPDSVARLDVLDLDPEVPPDTLVQDDGLVWMNTAGRLYVSRNEGQIFVLAYQGWDCDGLTDGDGWDPDDHLDACERFGGVNFRSVEVQDGKGRRIGRLSLGSALTFESELPISGPLKSAEPLPTMWWYRRAGATEWTLSKDLPNPTDPGSWEVVACTSARVEPVGFNDTPPVMRPLSPEKVEAARKAIETMKRRREGIASGYWPFGWEPDDKHRTYPDGHGGVIRLPNTERGRRAAWELERS